MNCTEQVNNLDASSLKAMYPQVKCESKYRHNLKYSVISHIVKVTVISSKTFV